MIQRILTEKEVAEMLKLSVHTLREWRLKCGRKVPLKFLRLGRTIRYEEREVLKFIERSRQG